MKKQITPQRLHMVFPVPTENTAEGVISTVSQCEGLFVVFSLCLATGQSLLARGPCPCFNALLSLTTEIQNHS